MGDKDGCLHLLNFPSILYKKIENEENYFLEFAENEKKRVIYYKSKLKNLQLQKQKNEEDSMINNKKYLEVNF